MSESKTSKVETIKKSLSANACGTHLAHCCLKIKIFDVFKLLSFVLIAVLIITAAKSFEAELCFRDLSAHEDANGKRPLQDHSFCHQNHICQLIVYRENNLNIQFDEKSDQEAFLFPPEELFLDGPFKPPKISV